MNAHAKHAAERKIKKQEENCEQPEKTAQSF